MLFLSFSSKQAVLFERKRFLWLFPQNIHVKTFALTQEGVLSVEDKSWLVKKGKLAIALPETKVFTARFSIQPDITLQAQKTALEQRVAELFPVNKEDLLYKCVVSLGGNDSEALCVGISRDVFTQYVQPLAMAGARLLYLTTTAIARYPLLTKFVTQGEFVLYLEIDTEALFALYDENGLVGTFSCTPQLKAIIEKIEHIRELCSSKYEKSLENIIVYNGKTIIAAEALSKKLSLSVQDVTQDVNSLVQKKMNLASPTMVSPEYLALIGLADCIQQKVLPNLASLPVVRTVKKIAKLSPPLSKERESEHAPRSTSKRYWPVVLAAVGVLFFLFVFYFVQKNSSVTQTMNPLATQAPKLTIQPTKAPLLRSELTVQILNGSGEEGKAALAAELFEELGYRDIEVGNADNYDYTTTKIQLKKEKTAYESLLKDDLGQYYMVDDTVVVLDSTAEFDVLIIVGSLAADNN